MKVGRLEAVTLVRGIESPLGYASGEIQCLELMLVKKNLCNAHISVAMQRVGAQESTLPRVKPPERVSGMVVPRDRRRESLRLRQRRIVGESEHDRFEDRCEDRRQHRRDAGIG